MYILADETTNEAAVIDPFNASKIAQEAKSKGVKVSISMKDSSWREEREGRSERRHEGQV